MHWTAGFRFCCTLGIIGPPPVMSSVSPLKLTKRCFLLLALCTCSLALHSAMATTNLLSIHLVAEWEPNRPPHGILKLISPPVLTDADFVSFDVTNQIFTITPDAARRLEAKIKNGPPTWLQGGFFELIPYPTACVVKASGEAVYVGLFGTRFSSSSFDGPVMLPDKEFISMSSTNDVTFRIQLGYPGRFPWLTDPRRDSRIVSAVQKLFSHERKPKVD